MTNRLFQDNWGDNSKPYTVEELQEASKRFKRNDRILGVAIAVWCVGWAYLVYIIIRMIYTGSIP